MLRIERNEKALTIRSDAVETYALLTRCEEGLTVKIMGPKDNPEEIEVAITAYDERAGLIFACGLMAGTLSVEIDALKLVQHELWELGHDSEKLIARIVDVQS